MWKWLNGEAKDLWSEIGGLMGFGGACWGVRAKMFPVLSNQFKLNVISGVLNFEG